MGFAKIETGQNVTKKKCNRSQQFATFAQFAKPFNASYAQDFPVASMNDDPRLRELQSWVTQFEGLEGAPLAPASTDASFRRYFRVSADRSYIVMDAPPPQEDCRPFVAIAGYLAQMGLNSPRVIATDFQRGFLLLTDLGSAPYLSSIEARPDTAPALYLDAIDALLVMQAKGHRFQGRLPPYDHQLLAFEISLFHDWLCGRHLNLRFTTAEEARWQACCSLLIDSALKQPRVFVHRDYHSRNLMLTSEDNPGILDFQDAVEGPLTYDLVSLLKDCYVKWPARQIDDWMLYFYERLPAHIPKPAIERFRRDFALMGVQRHLKAAGIFARLKHRDGKHGYMKDVPRTLSYIVDAADDYDELAFLRDLVATRVLPALEKVD